MSKKVSLQNIIGGGYYDFWHSKCTYVVCKGSRGSKKSKTAAIYHIWQMMKYPLSNTLVLRKVGQTLKDSAFSDLLWAIEKLGVSHLWKSTTSPLELTYKPTGQKILFRGLDNPFKITSISVPHGVLNFLWVEEAYEILKESDFDTVDESIRGELPDGYFQRITITFNPWSETHWLKKRFFDIPQDNVLALTTTYKCNEFLSETDIKKYEDIRRRSPKRARVACDGEWGIAEGIIYDNVQLMPFDVMTISKMESVQSIFGLDFGYTNDPTALFCGLVDTTNKTIYVFDEIYERGLVNSEIADRVIEKGYAKEKIIADCAEPKSIEELYRCGIRRIEAAQKGAVIYGIQKILGYSIIVHPKCVNFWKEISNYAWQTNKQGETINKAQDNDNHLMDAMRYAMEQIDEGGRITFF